MAKLSISVLFALVVAAVSAQKRVVKSGPLKENIQTMDEHLGDVIEDVHHIKSLLLKQENVIAQHKNKIDLQSKLINTQQREMLKQAQQIQEQSASISNLKEGLSKEAERSRDQSKKIDQCVSKITKRDQYRHGNVHNLESAMNFSSPDMYDGSDYVCIYDLLNLSCTGEGVIFITQAEYGQYAKECNEGCCAPNITTDCREALQTEDPAGWTNLIYACNYEASCTFQMQAYLMRTCAVETLADYMTVSYVCSQEQDPDPVVFTAYATTTRSYTAGQTLIFDNTLTNIGGHYHTSNSTFVCPYSGLYMFYINVMSDDSDYMIARLLLDDSLLVSAFADELTTSVDYVDNHASNMAFTDCTAGQEVRAESYDSGSYMSSTGNRLSTFSGYLLTRY